MDDDLARRLDGTVWRATEVAGTAVAEGVRTTLEIDGDRAFGRAGVNTYRGGFALDGATIVFGPLATTLMAGPPDASEQEARWLRALGHPATIRLDGDTLRLEHPDGSSSVLRRVPMVVVEGHVTYLSRIAMMPAAVVTVTLEDASRADAGSRVIARQQIDEPGNVPVAFGLRVDPSTVPAHAQLALRARIDVDGELRWTTEEHHPVDLTVGAVRHELVVRPV
jgi:heat shock protein HslJ